MSQSKTPVAVFTYNRPEHTRRCLEALLQCDRLEDCEVHIFCDAPKIEAHASSVEESRRVVKDYQPKLQAVVVERGRNIGIAKSIVAETTSLCKRYGRVIVLEDDLLVAPSFLRYMLEGLDRYKDDEQVYQISGYLFPLSYQPTGDAFFLPLTTSWGWAVWENRWNVFSWDPPEATALLADEKMASRFNLDGNYPFTKILRMRLAGRGDIWDILWWYAVFMRNGLVLYPKHSLVWNAGFDGSGVHCREDEGFQQLPLSQMSQQILSANLSLPERSATDVKAWLAVKKFLHQQSHPRRSFTDRVRDYLKRNR